MVPAFLPWRPSVKLIALKMKYALPLVIGGILAAGPVMADKPVWAGAGKGGRDQSADRRDEQRGEQRNERRDSSSAERRGHFDDQHRAVVREYYTEQFRGGR